MGRSSYGRRREYDREYDKEFDREREENRFFPGEEEFKQRIKRFNKTSKQHGSSTNEVDVTIEYAKCNE